MTWSCSLHLSLNHFCLFLSMLAMKQSLNNLVSVILVPLEHSVQ